MVRVINLAFDRNKKNQSLSTLVNMGFAFIKNHNVLVIPTTLLKCKWLK